MSIDANTKNNNNVRVIFKIFVILPNNMAKLSHQQKIVAAANSATGAIRRGVAARLFAAPAIALAWYRRRKPENHFFDIHGLWI